MLRCLTLFLECAGITGLSVLLSGCFEPGQEELSRAEPPRMRGECVAPSERERQIFLTAANAIELDDSPINNFLTIGAKQVLGLGLVSQGSKRVQRVCSPEDILSKVGAALATRGLGAGRLEEYQIELAVQLPNASDLVVEQVGRVAFNSSKQHSGIFPGQDIRPFARSALAKFGTRSSAFSDIAASEMHSRTSLGTGAAQVAAATGHSAAVPWIAAEMYRILGSVPSGVAIPLDKRDRLLELAWAVYFAGDAGRQSVTAIHRVMAGKVESRVPPFGIVEIRPKRFCRVLELIEGRPALEAYRYCLDDSIPFEQ